MDEHPGSMTPAEAEEAIRQLARMKAAGELSQDEFYRRSIPLAEAIAAAKEAAREAELGPPPISFEDFEAGPLAALLRAMPPEVSAGLAAEPPESREIVHRLLYLAGVMMSRNPGMGHSDAIQTAMLPLARLVLESAGSPEAAREIMRRVPWDTLAGLDEYGRETANATAMRAFDAAVAGLDADRELREANPGAWAAFSRAMIRRQSPSDRPGEEGA